MADITLYKNHTALLIADFYADQMSKLPHAVNRKCVEEPWHCGSPRAQRVCWSVIPQPCSGPAISR